MYQKTFLCLLIISATIRSVYNVPTRKSFELRVPGKAPIRIIDADPSWDGPGESAAVASEEFEHRTMKSNMRFRTTTPHMNEEEDDSREDSGTYDGTQFPSAKFQNFLKNYATKMHRKNQPMRDMDQVKLISRPDEDDEPQFSDSFDDNRSDNHGQGDKQDKANKWDLIHVQKYQQPVIETAETNRYHGGPNTDDRNTNKYNGNKVFPSNNYQGSSSPNNHKDKDSNKQGWVTLDAVPWSISKVSKWESNQQKNKRPWHTDSYGSGSTVSDKYNPNKYTTRPWMNSQSAYYGSNENSNPWEQYTSTVAYRPEKPSYKPIAGYRPNSNYYTSRPGYDKDELDNYHSSSSGLGTRPAIDYDQNLYNRPHIGSSLIQELPTNPYTEQHPWNRPNTKPPVIGSDYGRPYWNKLSQLHHNQQFHSDNSDCSHSQYKLHSGIITDGLPGNFPKDASNRRRGVETAAEEQPEKNEDHPETHPVNGNGEWVLLSTTKGYNRNPLAKQRSIKIVPAQRQVRLTVLPPDKKSKVNMTTSHGGLLEVESTFQTVEQAQRQYAKQMKFNGTRIGMVSPPKNKPTHVQKLRDANGIDSTAVVAAVGAGMIPAAAIGAMLVPMAMGRKRRSVFETTHHPLEYQLTLPRSL